MASTNRELLKELIGVKGKEAEFAAVLRNFSNAEGFEIAKEYYSSIKPTPKEVKATKAKEDGE